MDRALALLTLLAHALLVASAAFAGNGPGATGAALAHAHLEVESDASLTLEDVVRQTAAQEPGRAVVVARQEEALALGKDARRWLADAPALNADHQNDGILSDQGYQQWNVVLDLPLWWPGQRSGRRQTALAATAAAEHAERAHLLEVAGWVRQSIAELALARVRLELAETEWRAELKLVQQIERAVELEERAAADLLLARSASLDQRFRYLEALEESRHAEGAYVLLTGLTRWPAQWGEALAEERDLEDHPLLEVAAQEIARAEGELLRESRDQWGHPVLALGSQHEKSGPGAAFEDRIYAGIRIPLGRRAGARVSTSAAQRALAARKREAGRLRRELAGRLARAEHRIALTDQRAATATEQAAMAAEYLRLTEVGFGLGETDLGTLLRARARALAAEQKHREALILRRFGAAEFNQALGVVP